MATVINGWRIRVNVTTENEVMRIRSQERRARTRLRCSEV